MSVAFTLTLKVTKDYTFNFHPLKPKILSITDANLREQEYVCVCLCMCNYVPVVELKAWPPVRGPEESLQRTGQVYKHVAHEKEPVGGNRARLYQYM